MNSVTERRSPVPRRRAPFLLAGHDRTCRAQQWSYDPTTAQIVLHGHATPPSPDDLRVWADQLRRMGFERVRTTVIGAAAADFLADHGFRRIQELALLEHRRPAARRSTTTPDPDTRRLLAHERGRAAAVDLAAFGRDWGLDEFGVHDVCTATPRHRARAVDLPGHPLAGYAVAGRDGRQGFLQRIAVHPDARRRHVAAALVDDALRWAARWRVERVLVNTPVDNTAALELYRAAGFDDVSEHLTVHEQVLG